MKNQTTIPFKQICPVCSKLEWDKHKKRYIETPNIVERWFINAVDSKRAVCMNCGNFGKYNEDF